MRHGPRLGSNARRLRSSSLPQEAKIAAYEREIQQVVTNQGTKATPAGTVLGVGFDLDGSVAASVWEDTDTTSLAPGASIA